MWLLGGGQRREGGIRGWGDEPSFVGKPSAHSPAGRDEGVPQRAKDSGEESVDFHAVAATGVDDNLFKEVFGVEGQGAVSRVVQGDALKGDVAHVCPLEAGEGGQGGFLDLLSDIFGGDGLELDTLEVASELIVGVDAHFDG